MAARGMAAFFPQEISMFLPIPTREEAIAQFEQEQFQDEKLFEIAITRTRQLQDFYEHEEGNPVYIDTAFVLGARRFHWIAWQMRDWSLRIELAEPDKTSARTHLYKLIWQEAASEPLTENLAFNELFTRRLPLTGLQVLALMNQEDFVSMQYAVGRIQLAIKSRTQASDGEMEH
jgi:hypothetical protein